MSRLFVAAWPDPDTKDLLRAVPRPDEPGVRWVVEANWHITLRFLGDVDADEATALLAAAPLPTATVTLGPGIGRLGPQQLVIPATGADELADTVRAATAEIGQPDRRSFRGHLTIARTKRGARSTTLGEPFEASWSVDEIALVASELRPTGAVYTTVATFATT